LTQNQCIVRIADDAVASLGHELIERMQVQISEHRTKHAANNVAKRPLEFFIRLPREQLRPTYGQGFRGAPLQTDTEEPRSQTIRAGGSRAKVTQPTSEVSQSEEEL
jgi:hypothetical protein